MSQDISFPNPLYATTDCIAIGGDLSKERLLLAYEYGIFPWYNEGEEVHWYCPDPRFVLFPDDIYIAKSMRKYFNREIYKITYNKAFEKVIDHCQSIERNDQDGTWITFAMKKAYIELHQDGFARSVEVWDKADNLVGGLYGVDMNGVFYGESMFALAPDASKFALISLCQELVKKKYKLIDCQVYTDHLASLGAVFVPKKMFLQMLEA